MISEKAKGHLATFGAAVFFGLMSPISKLAMGQGVVDGTALATLRVAGAAVLFWLASLVVRDRQRIDWRKDWTALLGMSLCGMALNQLGTSKVIERQFLTNNKMGTSKVIERQFLTNNKIYIQ